MTHPLNPFIQPRELPPELVFRKRAGRGNRIRFEAELPVGLQNRFTITLAREPNLALTLRRQPIPHDEEQSHQEMTHDIDNDQISYSVAGNYIRTSAIDKELWDNEARTRFVLQEFVKSAFPRFRLHPEDARHQLSWAAMTDQLARAYGLRPK